MTGLQLQRLRLVTKASCSPPSLCRYRRKLTTKLARSQLGFWMRSVLVFRPLWLKALAPTASKAQKKRSRPMVLYHQTAHHFVMFSILLSFAIISSLFYSPAARGRYDANPSLCPSASALSQIQEANRLDGKSQPARAFVAWCKERHVPTDEWRI